ncbi:hypothetical protein ACFV6E_03260 [Streptomyces sp. NPDC059785]|uniref:hypothetical protein n=1 Tax=unclassified Streptomyces TaxID=2593676 RepID=UPI00366A3832
MERVGFSDEVLEAFSEAVRGTGWGESRYSVGARVWGGSWRALVIGLFFACVLGGLTTWLLVSLWPDFPFPALMALAIGYLLTAGILWVTWTKRPSIRHPATWVVVWEEGLAWLTEGSRPVACAWDEIAEARHTVTSVRDGFGKEFNRTHRLTVVPVPDPLTRNRLNLAPEFPFVEEIATFVARQVNTD